MPELPKGRENIDALVRIQRDNAEKANAPFDHNDARRRAREAAERFDRRNNK